MVVNHPFEPHLSVQLVSGSPDQSWFVVRVERVLLGEEVWKTRIARIEFAKSSADGSRSAPSV